MNNKRLPIFQRFGSEDSQDVDCLVFVGEIPLRTAEFHHLCRDFQVQLSELYPNDVINVNIAVMESGRLTKVFKGCLDETNNALYLTYKLHPQCFENQITHLIPRNIEHKLHRASRIILSYLSRTNAREIVKAALNSTIFEKIDALNKIDLLSLDFSQVAKKQNLEDVYKSIAFQFGQSLALMEGVEIYTKKELITFYPELEPFINRIEEANLSILSSYYLIFAQKLIELKTKFVHEYESEFSEA